MITESSPKRQTLKLACLLGLVAIGGIVTDAWAIHINNGAGRYCYICEGDTSGPGVFSCNENNADFTGECADGERATCSRAGLDQYSFTCAPCDPEGLELCDGDIDP